MGIIIGADFVPTESNYDLFAAGDSKALLGEELLSIISSARYRIFNLEGPLTDKETPIPKCGPNLIVPTGTINGYTAIGVDLLTIANNHIMDQDVLGFTSTVNTLDEAGIAYVGGGHSLAEASESYTFQWDGKTIGVYACAEHEFSIATETRCGANPFDPLWSLDHIEALRKSCDYVIVLYHGGKEHYRYPSPDLQKTCRRLVDKGADLVVCQHSHCIGCEEKYRDGTIVYGQGNFLFDHNDSEFWQTGLLVRIDEDWKISYYPLVKHGNAARLADAEKGREIMDAFYARSEEIQKPGTVEMKYAEFAKDSFTRYMAAFRGKRSVIELAMNKLSHGGYLRHKYGTKELLAIRNYIECEAHRELVISGAEYY